MGEAAIKEQKRREHATKIVSAFEEHINRLIYDAELSMNGDVARPNYIAESRNALIDILVTPPPK